MAVGSTDSGGTATVPATGMRTEVRPAPVALARRRRRLPWAMGLLVAAVLAGAAVAGLAAYNAGSEGGSPPATTIPAPVTTLAPPTTLPPPTAPPTPPPAPENRGKGDGGEAQKQLKKWLDEMRKQLEKAQTRRLKDARQLDAARFAVRKEAVRSHARAGGVAVVPVRVRVVEGVAGALVHIDLDVRLPPPRPATAGARRE